MSKLSEPMQAALYALYNAGESGKQNTMDALEKRGLLTHVNAQRVITAEGRKAIDAPNDLIGVQDGGVVLYSSVVAYDRRMEQGPADEPRESDDLVLVTEGETVGFGGSEESIESLLQGDPWKLGDAITEDEAYIILDSDGELKGAEGTEFDKFNDKWDDGLKVTAGFGATLDWRGTEVWDGLTAAEIKEDIKTATPINRNARRTHYRTLRNAFRRQTVQRPRKQIKIAGAVGV